MGFSNPEALGKVLDALGLPQFPHQNGDNAESVSLLLGVQTATLLFVAQLLSRSWAGEVMF